MAGADQAEDLRCPCKRKFAVVTEEGISLGCRGCDQAVVLPFAVLTSKAAVQEYLSTLPLRKQRFGPRPPRRPRKGAEGRPQK